MEICPWLLRGGSRCSLFLLYDIRHRTISTHCMVIQTFCSNMFCTTAVITHRNSQHNVHEQKVTKMAYSSTFISGEKWDMPNNGMASDVHKRYPDGRPCSFISRCMGSKWMKVGRTRLCYSAKTEKECRTLYL